jgi:hypothetical protein
VFGYYTSWGVTKSLREFAEAGYTDFFLAFAVIKNTKVSFFSEFRAYVKYNQVPAKTWQ